MIGLNTGLFDLVAIDMECGGYQRIAEEVEFGSLNNIALDVVRDRIIYTRNERNALYSYNLVSGEHALLSGDSRGSGHAFGVINDLVVDVEGDQVLTVGLQDTCSYSVDIESVVGQVVLSIDVGVGPKVSQRVGGYAVMAVDRKRGLIFVQDYNSTSVIAVDAQSGDSSYTVH